MLQAKAVRIWRQGRALDALTGGPHSERWRGDVGPCQARLAKLRLELALTHHGQESAFLANRARWVVTCELPPLPRRQLTACVCGPSEYGGAACVYVCAPPIIIMACMVASDAVVTPSPPLPFFRAVARPLPVSAAAVQAPTRAGADGV